MPDDPTHICDGCGRTLLEHHGHCCDECLAARHRDFDEHYAERELVEFRKQLEDWAVH